MPFRDAGTHYMLLEHTGRTERFIGMCETCIRPVAVELPGKLSDTAHVDCAECGRVVVLDRIYGTMTTEHTCDDTCQSARGSACVCACGGVNHGIGFLNIPGEATRPEYEARVASYRVTHAKKSEAAKKRAAVKKVEKEAKAVADKEAYVADNADVFAWLNENAAEGYSAGFATDLLHYFNAHSYLTDGQVAAVKRSITRDAEHAAKVAAAEASRPRVPCPVGKGITVTGTVKSVKVEEGYMADQPVVKMLVETSEGWRVWATVPGSIRSEHGAWVDEVPADYQPLDIWLPGKVVTFTAELFRSNRPNRDGVIDEMFAIAKRPTKAQLVKTDGRV